jgi:hypothetical protein
MKRFLLAVLAIVLACTNVCAQRNSPVAGNAATLIDLLKKDYNAVDIKLRDEEQLKDRAQVIGIFRSYLEDGYADTDPDNKDSLVKKIERAKISYDEYTTEEGIYNANSGSTITTGADGVARIALQNLTTIAGNVNTKRVKYYADRRLADKEELEALAGYYKGKNGKTGNTLVVMIIKSFIKKYSAVIENKPDPYATINNNAALQKNLLSVLGGSADIDMVIKALGKIIAEQIKKDLATFGVQYLKDLLVAKRDSTPVAELLVLLPATAKYIQDEDADKIAASFDVVQQYIAEDLNGLLQNASNLANTPIFREAIAKHPDIELAFEAFKMIPDLGKAEYPGSYFTTLNNSDLMYRFRTGTELQFNISASINLLEMISNSLTVIENGQKRFTSVDFWGNYGGDIRFIELYLGFLYQQNIKYFDVKFELKAKKFVLKTQLDLLMPKENAQKVFELANNFNQIAQDLGRICTDICKSSEQIYRTAENVRKPDKPEESDKADNAYNFVKSIIDFSTNLTRDADKLITTLSIDSQPPIKIAEQTERYLYVANAANEAYRAIHKKEYAAGLTQLLDVTTRLLSKDQQKHLPNYATFYTLSQLNYSSWADWQEAVKLVNKRDAITTDEAKFSISIADELSKVNFYYKANANQVDNTLSTKMANAKTVLAELKEGHKLTDEKINTLKLLTDDDGFKYAVISYYSRVMVTDLAADLQTTLSELVEAESKKAAPRFTKKMVDSFVDNLKAYLKAIYNNKIAKTEQSDEAIKKSEIQIRKEVLAFISALSENPGVKTDRMTVALIRFINGMMLAQNSADVEAAIRGLVSNGGTYLDKRRASFTVGLNTYPGLLGGIEFTGNKTSKFFGGVTAPVGLNVTWGNFMGKGSFGLFVPIIDVGAVTRIRFDNDDDTEPLPPLTLKNVFSPGLYIVIGFAKVPFSFNVGTQYGPEVKSISTGVSQSSFRLGAGVTIDIPLFNLYNKPAKFKTSTDK